MDSLLAHYNTVLMSNCNPVTRAVISRVALQNDCSYGVAIELILLAAQYGIAIREFTI